MKYPLVAVEWVDSGAHIDLGWDGIKEYVAKAYTQLGTVHTGGLLIHESETIVVIALSYDVSNDAVFGAQIIHQSNIVKLRRLEEVA